MRRGTLPGMEEQVPLLSRQMLDASNPWVYGCRGLQDPFRRADFHQVACIHDGNAVADGRYHGQVVGNDDDAQSQFPLQPFYQVDNLGLG
jgi:hypothetical protein